MRFAPILSAVFSVAALCVTPAFAADDPAAPADPGEKMVCKYQAKSGTRFKTKTCRTKAHWDLMSENARRQAAEDFNKPVIETRRE